MKFLRNILDNLEPICSDCNLRMNDNLTIEEYKKINPSVLEIESFEYISKGIFKDFSEWYEFGPHFITEGIYRGSFPSGHSAVILRFREQMLMEVLAAWEAPPRARSTLTHTHITQSMVFPCAIPRLVTGIPKTMQNHWQNIDFHSASCRVKYLINPYENQHFRWSVSGKEDPFTSAPGAAAFATGRRLLPSGGTRISTAAPLWRPP